MGECEYRNSIKYGWNINEMDICGSTCHYCSLIGDRCYHTEEKGECENYCRALEFERKNHLCNDRPKEVRIRLIEGVEDIEDINRPCGNKTSKVELPYGWYWENMICDPEDHCHVEKEYKFVKVKFCPFCGEKLLL